MELSEKLDKLSPALAKAQSEMGGAVKDSSNPFFKVKYSSLTSVWKACKEALHNNGFSVVQSPISADGRIGVETILLHESGQYIRDSYTLGVKKQNDPQADGSSITYARRYALAAFVGICPVDDDAEAAMVRTAAPEYISVDQQTIINDLIAEVGADKAKFLKYAQASAVDKIITSRYAMAVKALESKR